MFTMGWCVPGQLASALLGAIGWMAADAALADDDGPHVRLSILGHYKLPGATSSCIDLNDAGSSVGTTDSKMYRALDPLAGPPYPEIPLPPSSTSAGLVAIDAANTVLVKGVQAGISRAFLYGTSYSEQSRLEAEPRRPEHSRRTGGIRPAGRVPA